MVKRTLLHAYSLMQLEQVCGAVLCATGYLCRHAYSQAQVRHDTGQPHILAPVAYDEEMNSY